MKKVYSFLLLLCLLITVPTGAFASEVSNSPEIAPKGSLSGEITPYGAGEWDKIGTYTFKNYVRITSGGGNLKACVSSTTSKVKLNLVKTYVISDIKTTAGGSASANCATWTGLVGGGYDLYNDSLNGTSITVTVYD